MAADDFTQAPSVADEPLLVTKLHVPAPLRARAARPELVHRLRAAGDAALILVSAPAGSGKTTLLESWHTDPSEDRPFAWVSLDERDNDPVRLWSYIVTALAPTVPDLAPAARRLLRAPGVDVVEQAVPLLVNALADSGARVVIALDDYDLISNPEVHRSVALFIDTLPRCAQVAIATRGEPPFALARRRARAELCEVRGPDLRLTVEQATALLNDGLELALTPAQVGDLLARTEGWAAGLQLIGLSLQRREDRGRHVAEVSGDHRQLVDYLVGEVLERQTPQTREFLLRTSVLQRLNASLCDAVVGRDGSDETLLELERANLFLVALDDQRRSFRYHQLFRELLEHELARSGAGSGAVIDLHRRARAWYESHGSPADAIHHAMRAGDHVAAAELILANWLAFASRGEIRTVEGWLWVLPAEVLDGDPRLRIARAWMLLAVGRPAEIECEVRGALTSEPGHLGRNGHPPLRSMRASGAAVLASGRLRLGDVSGAVEKAREAERLGDDSSALWRPILSGVVGAASFWNGRLDEAAAVFEESAFAAHASGNESAAMNCVGYLAVIRALRGDLRGARELCEHGRDCEADYAHAYWAVVMFRYARAELLRLAGDLDSAARLAQEGTRLARHSGHRLNLAYGLLVHAGIERARGDASQARRLSAEAEGVLQRCADPGRLRDLLASPMTPSGLHEGASNGDGHLSARELVVLRLLPSGLSIREVGDELYISFNTARTHVRRIYLKLGVNSRADAVARARELGLL